MGIGTIGIPWVTWDSHGNGSDNDNITAMGVGIKVWNGNRATGMGMNSHCSFSQCHMRICSVIRELAKPCSHFIFTLARPSPEHVINVLISYRLLSICHVVNDFVYLF